MTNKQSIEDYAFLKACEELYYNQTESKVEIPKSIMPYVSGNMRLLKPISTEKDDIEKDFVKVWKKEFKFDENKIEDKAYAEKANASFVKFRSNKENTKKITEWFEKENTIELVKVDSFDGVLMPLGDLEIFERIMLKK